MSCIFSFLRFFVSTTRQFDSAQYLFRRSRDRPFHPLLLLFPFYSFIIVFDVVVCYVILFYPFPCFLYFSSASVLVLSCLGCVYHVTTPGSLGGHCECDDRFNPSPRTFRRTKLMFFHLLTSQPRTETTIDKTIYK